MKLEAKSRLIASGIKLSQIREGSIVIVQDSIYGNKERVRVDDVEDDFKYGLPGIHFTVLDSGEEYGAYLEQVVRVVKY